MSVRPIRLFGDPVLRTPAQPVDRLRQGAAHARRRPDRHHARAPGAGLAAPQLGVGLRVFTWNVDGEVGHLVNPSLTLSEEKQDGPEGCLSIPGLTHRLRAGAVGGGHGFDMHGEPLVVEGSELLARAMQHETDHLDGILFIDRLDREARKEAMRLIRESEWFGDGPPAVRVSPHPTTGSALRRPMRVVFAGTPEVAVPALDAVAASRHDLVGVVTRPDAPAGRGRRLVASPVAQRAEELGVPVLKPEHPRDPDFQAGAARSCAPDCCPVVAYGALLPQSALDIPPPRLGQPALLGAARVAWRRAGAARRCGPATRSPARPPSASSRSSTPGRPSG